MGTKTHDSLGRRLRTRSVSNGERLFLTDRDYDWFEILQRHGSLPTSYLHAFTKDRYKSAKMATLRLARLFHEKKTLHGGTYIERPFKQFETLDPRSNELVHALSPRALLALREAGQFSVHAPSPGGTFKHHLMVSCITASIELNALERGWTYISQQKILERAGTDLLIDVDGILRPDALFALDMDGKYMVFFLEADRATEPLDTKNIRKSWRHNVEQYQKLIGQNIYKTQFNLKANAVLLNVTVSEKRRDHMIAMVKECYPHGCSYVFSHALPEFGSFFRPPRVMNILDVYWQRSGNKPYKI